MSKHRSKKQRPVLLIWEELDLRGSEPKSEVTMYWIDNICEALADELYEAHSNYVTVVDGAWIGVDPKSNNPWDINSANERTGYVRSVHKTVTECDIPGYEPVVKVMKTPGQPIKRLYFDESEKIVIECDMVCICGLIHRNGPIETSD